MRHSSILIIAVFLVTVAGLLPFPVTAQETLQPANAAGDGATLEPQRLPVLLESYELLPDPATEIFLPSFEVRRWSDGTRSLVGTVEASLEELPLAFDYQVDLEAGTYLITASASLEDDRRPSPGTLTQTSERFRSEAAPGLLEGGEELQGIAGAATVSYSASGTVRTEDPPTLDLTKTTAVLDWTVTNGVTFNWTRTVDRCWAANPSALGTHWFIDWCTNDGGYFKWGDAPVCNRAEGKYHNDDFLDNSKRTHVQQWVETCGGNGFARFTWSHSDWGEAAGFLSGKFSSP